jgi:hypothetical protein
MKSIVYISGILLLTAIVSCVKEPASKPSLELNIEPSGTIHVGEEVVFTVTGEAEFMTLYTGDEGHVYDGSYGQKGTGLDMNADGKYIYVYEYESAGDYTVTAIAASYGNWGDEEIVKTVSQSVSVTDN